jgi:hypothetical protein
VCNGFADAASPTASSSSSSLSLSEDDEDDDDESDETGSSCRLPETVARMGRKGWTIADEMASAGKWPMRVSLVRARARQSRARTFIRRTLASLQDVARPPFRDRLAFRPWLDPDVDIAIGRDVVEADPAALVARDEIAAPSVEAEPAALV